MVIAPPTSQEWVIYLPSIVFMPLCCAEHVSPKNAWREGRWALPLDHQILSLDTDSVLILWLGPSVAVRKLRVSWLCVAGIVVQISKTLHLYWIINWIFPARMLKTSIYNLYIVCGFPSKFYVCLPEDNYLIWFNYFLALSFPKVLAEGQGCFPFWRWSLEFCWWNWICLVVWLPMCGAWINVFFLCKSATLVIKTRACDT